MNRVVVKCFVYVVLMIAFLTIALMTKDAIYSELFISFSVILGASSYHILWTPIKRMSGKDDEYEVRKILE